MYALIQTFKTKKKTKQSFFFYFIKKITSNYLPIIKKTRDEEKKNDENLYRISTKRERYLSRLVVFFSSLSYLIVKIMKSSYVIKKEKKTQHMWQCFNKNIWFTNIRFFYFASLLIFWLVTRQWNPSEVIKYETTCPYNLLIMFS